MSEGTKKQPYTYTLKTVAFSDLANNFICSEHIWMYITPPKDALTIENLYIHLIIEFDSGVSVDDRILRRIGIVNTIESGARFDPTQADWYRYIELNQAADGNRRVEVKMPLTHLLKKTNVRWQDLFSDQFGDEETYTYVVLQFPHSLVSNQTVGKILLWKLDALFTTTGIR